jgi:RNA polymerase sigma-70 factor (ECF subfamily)
VISFHQLYESYAADVYRFAFWLSGDGTDAEDITSETFIRAWVKSSSIRTGTLKAYLFTIARNLYLESKRNTTRQISLEDIYPDPNPGPEKAVETQFDILRVHNFLQTLPEIDRAAFIMRVQHELPYAEIARSLEISLSAAKVKVHRVRKILIAISLLQEEANS